MLIPSVYVFINLITIEIVRIQLVLKNIALSRISTLIQAESANSKKDYVTLVNLPWI